MRLTLASTNGEYESQVVWLTFDTDGLSRSLNLRRAITPDDVPGRLRRGGELVTQTSRVPDFFIAWAVSIRSATAGATARCSRLTSIIRR